MFPDDNDDFEPDRQLMDTLRERFAQMEDDLRAMGLYEPQVDLMPTPYGLVLSAQLVVGAVAFTERVQHPEVHQVNNEFAAIEANLQADTFLDERARLKRNLDAGRGPYDDGPA